MIIIAHVLTSIVVIAHIIPSIFQLNPSILTGIHQIVSAIKQYDYQSGLAVHSHLVSQGNFSEISAFMPGLKMLMQTALQLQVFV